MQRIMDRHSDLGSATARLTGRGGLIDERGIPLVAEHHESLRRSGPSLEELRTLYLDLLKSALTDEIYSDTRLGLEMYPRVGRSPRNLLRSAMLQVLQSRGLRIVRPYTASERSDGSAYPAVAHTMVGRSRLDHLQWCIEEVLRGDIPGDLIETGVWRGGATILMRGVLKANDVTNRIVWVADSFKGLPPPNVEKYPDDRGDTYFTDDFLRVSLGEVKKNFSRYGLLDAQVRFLEGWFKDTLPNAPISSIAVFRFDGDMYESTWDAMSSLYPKVSSGGFVVIDDYYVVPACRKAVHDYLDSVASEVTLERIPSSNDGVFWRKS